MFDVAQLSSGQRIRIPGASGGVGSLAVQLATAKGAYPPKQQACLRGTRSGRMVVEAVLSLLTRVVGVKKLSHRTWRNLLARLASTMALFNVLGTWNGLPVDADRTIHVECT